ncbi:type II toxin-antitoxin system RelE/ParE family toxin [Treponema parvum]|uniref:Type II toxin-antitoxin system RelE/ParE family toxin n=1 Tax=Treponema parvum TaxID=138851 RepID=A0A975EYG1_9SPIR|nr:type II toxin-antitoxin system RelE/ParE family toxin [Treponema parvum]QTQ11123.1 type II toxin-antitoxin system RelE/ParE family toxin [Treponema parvum]QTQ16936.1 type II toxin-antitoxin system RelE/ParE family toxin [Treponema parvum]
MYKIEYLPCALDDLKEIAGYIMDKLKNPIAAENLVKEIVEKIDLLSDFPYSAPCYMPIKPLTHEYRKLLVKNYFIFYKVNETEKTVTVARIIYARRNIGPLLETN